MKWNDLEKEIIGNSIQFLFDNKEINKISVVKKVKGAVFGWIKTNFFNQFVTTSYSKRSCRKSNVDTAFDSLRNKK